jgi:hypothetical protein
MRVQFANSYIDRLFTERDFLGLHHLFSVMERDRHLPDGCWIFCRILEWFGSTRSGVWQYYESIPNETFQRVSQALDNSGHSELANRYRSGMTIWDGPDRAASLDKWMDEHEHEIRDVAFDFIRQSQDVLKKGAS